MCHFIVHDSIRLLENGMTNTDRIKRLHCNGIHYEQRQPQLAVPSPCMSAIVHADIILYNVLPWSGIDIQYFE
jgi:hypothetical protein